MNRLGEMDSIGIVSKAITMTTEVIIVTESRFRKDTSCSTGELFSS